MVYNSELGVTFSHSDLIGGFPLKYSQISILRSAILRSAFSDRHLRSAFSDQHSQIGISDQHSQISTIRSAFLDQHAQITLSQFSTHRPVLSAVSNTLDVILSNDPLIINIIEVSEPFSTSDHCMINFSLLLPPSKQHTSVVQPSDQSPLLPIYDWSAGNFEAINNSLSTVDWHLLFGYNFNADDLWIEF